MKKTILVLSALLSFSILLGDASAQDNAKAKASAASAAATNTSATSAVRATAADQDAVDVTPQYDAALQQKRDGKFPLYTDDEGTKVFLSVKSGHPPRVSAVGRRGNPVRISWRRLATKCFICFGPDSNPCGKGHRLQIKCPVE